MKNIFCSKFIIMSVIITFLLSMLPNLEAGEIAVKIPFGHGTNPKKSDTIEKLKNETTKGAGAAIGLIVLGVCIVAAAVIIANKADDVTDKASDKADSLSDKADTYYDENT